MFWGNWFGAGIALSGLISKSFNINKKHLHVRYYDAIANRVNPTSLSIYIYIYICVCACVCVCACLYIWPIARRRRLAGVLRGGRYINAAHSLSRYLYLSIYLSLSIYIYLSIYIDR